MSIIVLEIVLAACNTPGFWIINVKIQHHIVYHGLLLHSLPFHNRVCMFLEIFENIFGVWKKENMKNSEIYFTFKLCYGEPWFTIAYHGNIFDEMHVFFL